LVKGIVGQPWVLGGAQKKAGRGKGAEGFHFQSQQKGAGQLANRAGKGKRKQCGTVTSRKPKG